MGCRLSSCSVAPSKRWADHPSVISPTDDPASHRVIRVSFIPADLRPGRGRCPGKDIFTVDPSAEVDEAAPLGAEGKGRQVANRCDLKAAGAGWTASPNHDSLLGLVAAGFAGSELDGLVELGEAEESPEVFGVPLDADLSASAAFL
jgi:hypothetical protein